MTDKSRNNIYHDTTLFLLVAIIMGNSHKTDAFDHIVRATAKPIPQKPVLQPTESVPITGNYVLKDPNGKECIKVSMGVEYIIIEKKKSSYFNLDPRHTQISGICEEKKAVFSLAILGEGGFLELSFVKNDNKSYLSKVQANLSPGKSNKNYPGVIDHEKLFPTDVGCSLKCKSQTEFHLSENLRVKIVSLQFQAFKLTNGSFGPEVECWTDFMKRIIPIIVGSAVVALLLIAILTFLIIRDRRRQSGYDRI
ncbi:lysosome-associated membrane glycoprotein 1 [Esox lucius]|uniref:Lysosome-associated membrane glycoprotein 2-like luminal domain-containing protein n=1 Tax=Esox lucius TaxID=8010 RepID=A0A3P8ZV34_ESOLU|nr:lysosome-associated membrane glycoprotein 1 [Esox lucius]